MFVGAFFYKTTNIIFISHYFTEKIYPILKKVLLSRVKNLTSYPKRVFMTLSRFEQINFYRVFIKKNYLVFMKKLFLLVSILFCSVAIYSQQKASQLSLIGGLQTFDEKTYPLKLSYNAGLEYRYYPTNRLFK